MLAERSRCRYPGVRAAGSDGDPGRVWASLNELEPPIFDDRASRAVLRDHEATVSPGAALVLVVEDDAELRGLVCAYLARAGFRTECAATVMDAMRLNEQLRPDLILLDIGLRSGDGFEVLSGVRRRHETPVIMVTALDDEVTKLSSFRIGADDFVVKPFNPNELVERVRAVLRRARGERKSRTLAVANVRIDLDSKMVTSTASDGTDRVVQLTSTEFEVLAHMARHPGRVYARSELIDAVLPHSEALERVIDSHVSHLRRKLLDGNSGVLIQPVRGVGYRLLAR